MPQISAQEFERVPLRVHEFLADVPLHDVWAVDLPRLRPGITLDEFLRAAGALPMRPSPVARALLGIRFTVGRLLGWDHELDTIVSESFAVRLTPDDLSKSVAPAGRREGPFRVVYRFENEQLLEDRPRRGAERPRGHRNCVSFLFRRLRSERRPLDAGLHRPHRPVQEVDRLPVITAERSRVTVKDVEVDRGVRIYLGCCNDSRCRMKRNTLSNRRIAHV